MILMHCSDEFVYKLQRLFSQVFEDINFKDITKNTVLTLEPNTIYHFSDLLCSLSHRNYSYLSVKNMMRIGTIEQGDEVYVHSKDYKNLELEVFQTQYLDGFVTNSCAEEGIDRISIYRFEGIEGDRFYEDKHMNYSTSTLVNFYLHINFLLNMELSDSKLLKAIKEFKKIYNNAKISLTL